MNEKISVIVPIYKVEHYLRRCLDSIINQTYSHLEIILVDDGSPDGCPAICDEYKEQDNRIKVIHQKNGGLSCARNSGLKIATSKYVTFIDSDDYIEEDYIEYLYHLITKHKTEIAICDYSIFSDHLKGKKNEEIKNEECLSQKDVIEKMLYTEVYFISAWGKLYNRELFQDIEFPDGMIYEDLATTYQLILKTDRVACGYEKKYNYYMREDSITKQKFSEKQFDMITNTEKMTSDIEKIFPEYKNGCIARNMHAYLSTYCRLLYEKDKYLKEKRYILQCIKKSRKVVLSDHKAQKKDKTALVVLLFGEPIFKFIWTMYRNHRYKME